jgi:AraC-like DNA-binding protein
MTSTLEPDAASFRFFPATGPLRHFVAYFFASSVPGGFVDGVDAVRLPEVEAQLVFVSEAGRTFPAAQAIGGGLSASLFLQPAHLHVVPISSTIRGAVGAALRPAGLRILLDDGAELLGAAPLIALEELCGAPARRLFARLLEARDDSRRVDLLRHFLLDRLARTAEPNRSVVRMIELMQAAGGQLSVETLAQSCGCSSRTLRNAAVSELGLAPKQLARIVRIRRALELLVRAGIPLGDAATRSAFSDQAHMSREFRAMIGAAPAHLGKRIHAPGPSFASERNLIDTGLLILPKPARA